jgi:Gluconate 2-dehydrogenase subunit 3
MSNEPLLVAANSADGPLRHFRVGRRAMLQSLATGVGAAVFASSAAAAHAHPEAAQTATPAGPATDSALLFLDQHAFDTLALLGEQIIPGSRAVGTAEFLDRLLAVESTETQKGFAQALGAFEREAREAHGKPWKALPAEQATALLAKISMLPDSDAMRRAFDGVKGAVAETYFSSAVGKEELGWNRSVAFAPPAACETQY